MSPSALAVSPYYVLFYCSLLYVCAREKDREIEGESGGVGERETC